MLPRIFPAGADVPCELWRATDAAGREIEDITVVFGACSAVQWLGDYWCISIDSGFDAHFIRIDGVPPSTIVNFTWLQSIRFENRRTGNFVHFHAAAEVAS